MSLAGPDAAAPLQKAVYEALIAVNVCGGSVFATVPQNAQLPFCQIGDDDLRGELDAGGFTRATVNVNVYAASKKQAKIEAGMVKLALDAEINIEQFSVAEYLYQATLTTVQPDGETVQCAVSFEYLLIPTS